PLHAKLGAPRAFSKPDCVPCRPPRVIAMERGSRWDITLSSDCSARLHCHPEQAWRSEGSLTIAAPLHEIPRRSQARFPRDDGWGRVAFIQSSGPVLQAHQIVSVKDFVEDLTTQQARDLGRLLAHDPTDLLARIVAQALRDRPVFVLHHDRVTLREAPLAAD